MTSCSTVDCVLKNLLTSRTDIFGENSIFVDFEQNDDDFNWSDGFQSSAHFGRILYHRWDENQVRRSDHLVLKVTPSTVFMKEFSPLAFFNEIFFYTRILPFFEVVTDTKVDRFFPKYYNSLLQYNVSSDEAVIVFENLQAKGYALTKKKSFLDYDHLRLAMEKLGEFHALSYHARQEAPEKFHALTRCMVETNGTVLKQFPTLFDCQWRGFCPLQNDPHYGSKIKKLSDLSDLIRNPDESFAKILLAGDVDNPTHVLCHGDFLRNNVLFKYENGKPIDLKMVDLANWRFGSPVIDLALILYLNADQKMRDENWDNLMDAYYSAVFRNTFPAVKTPSKSSILAEFKTKAMLGYYVASYFLPLLIVQDDDEMPKRTDFFPEYEGVAFTEVPRKILLDVRMIQGGDLATKALENILKDIIDRGFV